MSTTGDRPRYKRHLRNYLLDKSFQLKYAGFIFGVAAVLSIVMGALLWRTSQRLVDASQTAVSQGQYVVELGKKVAKESEKVSKVVQMNLVEDPFYADNPELLAAFESDSEKKNAVLIEQQQALEAQAASLQKQSAEIESGQQTMLITLFAVLLILSVAVGLAGIVVTHKVAGPIHKMIYQIKDVEDGHWNMPSPLRKGDELVHFFDAFEHMVVALRKQREHELQMLDQLRERLGEMSPEQREIYDELHKELRYALHGDEEAEAAS